MPRLNDPAARGDLCQGGAEPPQNLSDEVKRRSKPCAACGISAQPAPLPSLLFLKEVHMFKRILFAMMPCHG